ncbi:hypothetical protein HY483_00270 [Candidatus Woesearchaeota archaeon]|nr:hypothetical protein [Candidatus Woesearchaeota archaeon]
MSSEQANYLLSLLDEKVSEAQRTLDARRVANEKFLVGSPVSTAAIKYSAVNLGLKNALHELNLGIRKSVEGAATQEEFYSLALKYLAECNISMPEDPETRTSVHMSIQRIRRGVSSALDSRSVENIDITELF